MKALVLSLALLAGTLAAQQSPAKPEVNASTVVFVCEHGAAKSVIAAAEFNRIAAEKGLPFRAVARGTKPDEAIAPVVKTGLSKEGIDVSSWRPQSVTHSDIDKAGKVVSIAAFEPGAKPAIGSRLLEWNDVPSVSENYQAARDAIVKRVQALLDNMAARKQ